MLLIVVLFVGAAFVMLRAHPASSPSTTTTLATTTTIHHGSTTHPSKARVRVQVANGTSTSNLARTYTDKLQAIGWDTLAPLNASNKVAATSDLLQPRLPVGGPGDRGVGQGVQVLRSSRSTVSTRWRAPPMTTSSSCSVRTSRSAADHSGGGHDPVAFQRRAQHVAGHRTQLFERAVAVPANPEVDLGEARDAEDAAPRR